MKTLKFPEGGFNQSSFERENGFQNHTQWRLIQNLSKNGSIESRVSPKGGRMIRLYRRVQRMNDEREPIYSAARLHDLFGLMGLNEMAVLTTETQSV